MNTLRELLIQLIDAVSDRDATIAMMQNRLDNYERDINYYRDLYLKAEDEKRARGGKELWQSMTAEQVRDVIDVYNEAPGYQLIPAVKRVRELTGWGLKESKDAVDYYREHVVA